MGRGLRLRAAAPRRRVAAAAGLAGAVLFAVVPAAWGGARASSVLPSPLPSLPLPALPTLPPLPQPLPGTAAGLTFPPLGPQPVVAAPDCTFTTPAGQAFTLLFAQQQTDEAVPPAVDPWVPCHIYRSFPHQVERSDQMGATFQTIFQDSPTATGTQMLAGQVQVTSDGGIYFADTTGAKGIFYSPDRGAHWEERDGGLVPLAGQPPAPAPAPAPAPVPATVPTPAGARTGIVTLAFAPSQPSTGYLVTVIDGQTVLHHTTDGGADWSALTPPAQNITALAIDPANAGHIWIATADAAVSAAGGAPTPAPTPPLPGVTPSPLPDVPSVPAATPSPPATASTASLLESSDGGGTWTQLQLPPDGAATQLYAARAHGGAGSVLVAQTDGGSPAGNRYWRTTDDSTHWGIPLPLPVLDPVIQASGFAIAPLDGDAMVWAGALDERSATNTSVAGTLVVGTTDAFAGTVARKERFLQSQNNTLPDDVRVLADRAGDFFLDQRTPQGSGGAEEQMYAFRTTGITPPQLPGGGLPPPPEPGSVPAIQSCQLGPPPSPPLLIQPPSTDNSGRPQPSLASGSITFDGRYLDFTDDTVHPNTIFRVDPLSCQQGAPIILPVSDTGGRTQAFYALTYDARYRFGNGDAGAILARGEFDQRVPDAADYVPVYAVDVLDGHAELVMGVWNESDFTAAQEAGRTGSGGHDPTDFTYDIFTDRLWAGVRPTDDEATTGELYTAHGQVRFPSHQGDDATRVETCMTLFSPPLPADNQAAGTMSAWVVGADGIMYVQSEDDRTVYRVDSRTCTALGSFTHDLFREVSDENDQMACDPLTFGAGSAYASAVNQTSVLWIRDGVRNTADAYPIVDGYCPFPTITDVSNPGLAHPGDTLQVCANVRTASAGLAPGVIAATVSFTVAGKAVGWALTDDTGLACTQVASPQQSGTFPVSARFAGTNAYLASAAASSLRVIAPPVTPPQFDAVRLAPLVVTRFAPLLPPNQQIPPPSDLTPISQASTQAQAQSQAQAQAQSQMQPAAMVQEQEQPQVAFEAAGDGKPSDAPSGGSPPPGPGAGPRLAVRPRPAPRAVPMGAAAAGVALMFALVAVTAARRRHAFARIPRRR